MLYTAKAEYRGNSRDFPDFENEYDADTPEEALNAACRDAGMALFRGPIYIYDEDDNLILSEDD